MSSSSNLNGCSLNDYVDDKTNYDLQVNDVIVTSYNVMNYETFKNQIVDQHLTLKGLVYGYKNDVFQKSLREEISTDKLLVWDLISTQSYDQELTFAPTTACLLYAIEEDTVVYTVCFFDTQNMLLLNADLELTMMRLDLQKFLTTAPDILSKIVTYTSSFEPLEYNVNNSHRKLSNLFEVFNHTYDGMFDNKHELRALGYLDTFKNYFSNGLQMDHIGNKLWLTAVNTTKKLTGRIPSYLPRQICCLLTKPSLQCIKSRVKSPNFVIKTVTNLEHVFFLSTNSNVIFNSYGSKLTFDYVLSHAYFVELQPNRFSSMPKVFAWYQLRTTQQYRIPVNYSNSVDSLSNVFHSLIAVSNNITESQINDCFNAILFTNSCVFYDAKYIAVFENFSQPNPLCQSLTSPHDTIYSLLIALYQSKCSKNITVTARAAADDLSESDKTECLRCKDEVPEMLRKIEELEERINLSNVTNIIQCTETNHDDVFVKSDMFQAMSAKIKSLTEENAKLEKLKTALNDCNVKIAADHDYTKSMLADTMFDCKKLNDDMAILHDTILSRDKNIHELSSKIEEDKKTISELNKTFSDAINSRDAFEKQCTELSSELEKNKKILTELNQTLSDTVNSRDTFEKQCVKLSENIAALNEKAKNTIDQLNKNLDDGVKSRHTLEKNCMDLKIEISTMKERERKLNEELTKVKSNNDPDVLREIKKNYKSEISKLTVERDRFKTDLEEHVSKNSQLESERNKLSKTVADRDTKITNLKREIASLEKKNVARKDTSERDELERFKTIINNMTADIATKDTLYNKLKNEFDTLQHQYDSVLINNVGVDLVSAVELKLESEVDKKLLIKLQDDITRLSTKASTAPQGVQTEDELCQQCADKDDIIQDINSKLVAITAKCDLAELISTENVTKLNDHEKKMNEMMGEKDKKINQLELEVKVAQESCCNYTAEITNKDMLLIAANDKIQQFEQDFKNLKCVIPHNKAKPVVSKCSDCDLKNTIISEKNSLIIAKNAEIKRLEMKLVETCPRCQKLTKELRKSEKDHEQLFEKYSKLRVAKACDKCDNMQRIVDHKDNQIDTLRQELEFFNNPNTDHGRQIIEIQRLEELVKHLKQKIKEKNLKISNLNEETKVKRLYLKGGMLCPTCNATDSEPLSDDEIHPPSDLEDDGHAQQMPPQPILTDDHLPSYEHATDPQSKLTKNRIGTIAKADLSNNSTKTHETKTDGKIECQGFTNPPDDVKSTTQLQPPMTPIPEEEDELVDNQMDPSQQDEDYVSEQEGFSPDSEPHYDIFTLQSQAYHVCTVPHKEIDHTLTQCPDADVDQYHEDVMSLVNSFGPIQLTLSDGTLVNAVDNLDMLTSSFKFLTPIEPGKHSTCTLRNCNFWLKAASPNDLSIEKNLPLIFSQHSLNENSPDLTHRSSNYVLSEKLATTNLFKPLTKPTSVPYFNTDDVHIWIRELMSGEFTTVPAMFNTFVMSETGYAAFIDLFENGIKEPRIIKAKLPSVHINTHFDRFEFVCWFMFELNSISKDGTMSYTLPCGKTIAGRKNDIDVRKYTVQSTPWLSRYVWFDQHLLPDLSDYNGTFQFYPNLEAPTNYRPYQHKPSSNQLKTDPIWSTVLEKMAPLLDAMLSDVTASPKSSNVHLLKDSNATVFGVPVYAVSMYLEKHSDHAQKLVKLSEEYNSYFSDDRSNADPLYFPMKVIGYLAKISVGIKHTDINRAIAMNCIRASISRIKLVSNIELLPIVFDFKYLPYVMSLQFLSPTFRLVYHKLAVIRDPLLSRLMNFSSNIFYKYSDVTRPYIDSVNASELKKTQIHFNFNFVAYVFSRRCSSTMIPITKFPTMMTEILAFKDPENGQLIQMGHTPKVETDHKNSDQNDKAVTQKRRQLSILDIYNKHLSTLQDPNPAFAKMAKPVQSAMSDNQKQAASKTNRTHAPLPERVVPSNNNVINKLLLSHGITKNDQKPVSSEKNNKSSKAKDVIEKAVVGLKE